MTMLDAYAAVMAGLLATGVVLLVGGLRGTTEPPSPPPAALAGLRRWWRGNGRTTVERRARQATIAAGVIVGLATFVLTGIPIAALLAGLALPAVPWLWNAGRAERLAIGRAEAVGEWARRLADRLSVGSGLVAALVNSADNAPPPIAEQVRALATRIRAGTAPERALRTFAAEVDDTVAEQVVAALLLHLQDRGEHLSAVLAALSEDAARVVAMRREVDAKRAQPRMTVRFMIVFAGVVTAALAHTGLLGVYRTAAGQLVLLVVAAAFAAVLIWVASMSRPPAPQRLLTTTGPG